MDQFSETLLQALQGKCCVSENVLRTDRRQGFPAISTILQHMQRLKKNTMPRRQQLFPQTRLLHIDPLSGVTLLGTPWSNTRPTTIELPRQRGEPPPLRGGIELASKFDAIYHKTSTGSKALPVRTRWQHHAGPKGQTQDDRRTHRRTKSTGLNN